MTTRDELLTALRERPVEVYAFWLAQLGTSARQHYTQTGVTAEESARALQCTNELAHRLSHQLRDTLLDSHAYSPEELLDILEQAACGVCSGDLQWSAKQVLRDLARGAHDR